MNTSLPVVIGFDGTPESRPALNWAAEEARLRQVALRIVCGDTNGTTQADLDKAVAWARELGAEPVGGFIGPTRPVELLLDESEKAVVVAVGSHEKSAETAIVLGSVGSAVAAHARCPVVVVRPDHDPPTRPRIVVGVDGSALSEEAMAFAFEEAELRRLAVHAVHCWRRDGTPEEKVQQELNDRLIWLSHRMAAHRRRRPGVRAKMNALEGREAAILTEQSRGATLLVVGTHGRGGVTGLTLGSASRHLLHHAPCPVAVVHHAGLEHAWVNLP